MKLEPKEKLSKYSIVIPLLLIALVICLFQLSSVSAFADDVLSSGPLEPERKKLWSEIQELEKKGVGTKPFVQSFNDLDELVKSGGSESDIHTRIDRLERAVVEQLQSIEDARHTGVRVYVPSPITRYCEAIKKTLSKRWTATKSDDDLSLTFNVSNKGTFSGVEIVKDAKGSAEAHERFKKALLGVVSAGAPPTHTASLKLKASYNIKGGLRVYQNDVDFSEYMADVQRRIKRAWYPPKGEESKRVSVIFKVASDGSTSNLRVFTSSGIPIVDQAATKAVLNAAPFRPLPDGADSSVDIQFTFDYNVFNNNKGPGVYRRF